MERLRAVQGILFVAAVGLFSSGYGLYKTREELADTNLAKYYQDRDSLKQSADLLLPRENLVLNIGILTVVNTSDPDFIRAKELVKEVTLSKIEPPGIIIRLQQVNDDL